MVKMTPQQRRVITWAGVLLSIFAVLMGVTWVYQQNTGDGLSVPVTVEEQVGAGLNLQDLGYVSAPAAPTNTAVHRCSDPGPATQLGYSDAVELTDDNGTSKVILTQYDASCVTPFTFTTTMVYYINATDLDSLNINKIMFNFDATGDTETYDYFIYLIAWDDVDLDGVYEEVTEDVQRQVVWTGNDVATGERELESNIGISAIIQSMAENTQEDTVVLRINVQDFQDETASPVNQVGTVYTHNFQIFTPEQDGLSTYSLDSLTAVLWVLAAFLFSATIYLWREGN